MPIVVRHTPVGLLTRLAVESGQARRQEIQAQRDIQLQQAAWATEERGADVAARRAEQQQAQEFRQAEQQQAQMAARQQQDVAIIARQEAQQQAQTFTLQRIEAAKISRERTITQAERREQEELQQAVSQAKATGVYRPEQIKQAEIFADLGDKAGMRGILRAIPRPPTPTAKQKELQQQTEAIGELAQQDLDKIDVQISKRQEKIDALDAAKPERYAPVVWEGLVETDPSQLPKDIRGSVKKRQGLVAEQQQLQLQKQSIEQQTEQVERQLKRGFTIPEQVKRQARRSAQQRKIRIEGKVRIEKRVQRRLERKITALERKTKIDIDRNPALEETRVDKVRTEIDKLEGELKESYQREDAALGGALAPPRMTPSERENALAALMAEAKGDPIEVQRLAAERGLE